MKASLRELRARLEGSGRPGPGSDLRQRLKKLSSREPLPGRPSPPDDTGELALALGGQWRMRPSGRVLSITRDFPASHRHGESRLETLGSLDPETVCLLAGDDSFHRFDLSGVLFMDTETTGLAGGAGTYVFLIGIGFFEQGRFRTQQFFLPAPQSERAFLEELTGTLQTQPGLPRFRHLISFNGKSYDLSLIENRFILQRMENPFRLLPHLDLLHPSRLLWGGCFENCRLQTLEARVLGFHRSGDIPSSLIPRVYLDFLHGGGVRPFQAVLEHNRLDLLSMVTLLREAGRLLRERGRPGPMDPVSASRIYTRGGRHEDAAALLEASRDQPGHGGPLEVLLELVRVRKRLGQTAQVLELCYQIIEGHPRPPSHAFEEAAKILEHQQQELGAALRLVDQALAIHPRLPALRHRRHRLECRLAGKKWY